MEFNKDILVCEQFNIIDYIILTNLSGAIVDYQEGEIYIRLDESITSLKRKIKELVVDDLKICNRNTVREYYDTSLILNKAAAGLTLIRENTPFSFIQKDPFYVAFRSLVRNTNSIHTLNQMMKLFSHMFINCSIFGEYSKSRERICQELELPIKAFSKYMKLFENTHLFYVARKSSAIEGITRAYGVNDNFIPKGLRKDQNIY